MVLLGRARGLIIGARLAEIVSFLPFRVAARGCVALVGCVVAGVCIAAVGCVVAVWCDGAGVCVGAIGCDVAVGCDRARVCVAAVGCDVAVVFEGTFVTSPN